MMLPGWVTSNEESVKQEAADYINMTPSEKASIVAMLCRDAVMIASSRPDADRVFAYRDRISDETKTLLRRLRDSYRESRSR
jgi:hypothetical protein